MLNKFANWLDKNLYTLNNLYIYIPTLLLWLYAIYFSIIHRGRIYEALKENPWEKAIQLYFIFFILKLVLDRITVVLTLDGRNPKLREKYQNIRVGRYISPILFGVSFFLARIILNLIFN